MSAFLQIVALPRMKHTHIRSSPCVTCNFLEHHGVCQSRTAIVAMAEGSTYLQVETVNKKKCTEVHTKSVRLSVLIEFLLRHQSCLILMSVYPTPSNIDGHASILRRNSDGCHQISFQNKDQI